MHSARTDLFPFLPPRRMARNWEIAKKCELVIHITKQQQDKAWSSAFDRLGTYVVRSVECATSHISGGEFTYAQTAPPFSERGRYVCIIMHARKSPDRVRTLKKYHKCRRTVEERTISEPRIRPLIKNTLVLERANERLTDLMHE